MVRFGVSGTGIAPVSWLFRILRGSGCKENAATQEVEAGPAVHCTLDQLQAGDLALGQPVASGCGDCSAHSGPVLLEARRKGLDGADAACAGFGEPGIQLATWCRRRFITGDTTTADERCEAPGQAGDPCRFAILFNPHCRSGRVGRQGRHGLHQNPGQLFGRG